jgi:hypothetical protein
MTGMKVTYSVMLEPKLSNTNENKLSYEKSSNPKFFFQLRKSDSRRRFHLVLFKQIKQDKPNELPINIVVFATTSQILHKSDGLSAIKKKYEISQRTLPL